MTHLVTKIFGGISKRPARSDNGLAIFCAFVCVFTCCFSLVTSTRNEAEPTDEFFELATDLKTRIKTLDEVDSEFGPYSQPASHVEEN